MTSKPFEKSRLVNSNIIYINKYSMVNLINPDVNIAAFLSVILEEKDKDYILEMINKQSKHVDREPMMSKSLLIFFIDKRGSKYRTIWEHYSAINQAMEEHIIEIKHPGENCVSLENEHEEIKKNYMIYIWKDSFLAQKNVLFYREK